MATHDIGTDDQIPVLTEETDITDRGKAHWPIVGGTALTWKCVSHPDDPSADTRICH